MSIVKSFSVGNGDMFYIKHETDSFTIIDCNLTEDDDDSVAIVSELKREAQSKGIRRFISTHPDDDHIGGLQYLNDEQEITNFYCVRNAVTKEEETASFRKYCEFRDAEKTFYLSKGCSRRWLNEGDEERASAGIAILWPVLDNEYFKQALKFASEGNSPNNISPIIQYSTGKTKIMWMGDLETDFMDNISNSVKLSEITILFAPHHGRDSGKVPQDWLDVLQPKIVIIGEAPSADLNYYQGYNTMTQNSAGRITLDCRGQKVHIHVSEPNYAVDFLDDEEEDSFDHYLGTLNL